MILSPPATNGMDSIDGILTIHETSARGRILKPSLLLMSRRRADLVSAFDTSSEAMTRNESDQIHPTDQSVVGCRCRDHFMIYRSVNVPRSLPGCGTRHDLTTWLMSSFHCHCWGVEILGSESSLPKAATDRAKRMVRYGSC